MQASQAKRFSLCEMPLVELAEQLTLIELAMFRSIRLMILTFSARAAVYFLYKSGLACALIHVLYHHHIIITGKESF